MDAKDSSVIVYVTYQGAPQDHFDRDYYVAAHLPLVMEAWEQHGLLKLSAFFPAGNSVGTVAICECVFRDEAALEVAFSSPETAGVMADVPRFTNLAPARVRAVSL